MLRTKIGKTLASVALAGSLAMVATPAEAQQASLKGDVTAKYRVADNLPLEQSPARFRVNALFTYDFLQVGTRHDAPFNDPGNAYGMDYGGFKLGELFEDKKDPAWFTRTLETLRVGASRVKGPLGNTWHAQVHTSPLPGLIMNLNVGAENVFFAQYSHDFEYFNVRGMVLDNLNKERVQTIEAEVTFPFKHESLGLEIMGKLVGTPVGYSSVVTAGVTYDFNFGQ